MERNGWVNVSGFGLKQTEWQKERFWFHPKKQTEETVEEGLCNDSSTIPLQPDYHSFA